MARNRDIRENTLFTIAKRETPKGFFYYLAYNYLKI